MFAVQQGEAFTVPTTAAQVGELTSCPPCFPDTFAMHTMNFGAKELRGEKLWYDCNDTSDVPPYILLSVFGSTGLAVATSHTIWCEYEYEFKGSTLAGVLKGPYVPRPDKRQITSCQGVGSDEKDLLVDTSPDSIDQLCDDELVEVPALSRMPSSVAHRKRQSLPPSGPITQRRF